MTQRVSGEQESGRSRRHRSAKWRLLAPGLILLVGLGLLLLRSSLPIAWLPEYQNWFGAPSVFETEEPAGASADRLTRIGDAIAYDLTALGAMDDPTLAIVGSSIVGPLDERALEAALPGWHVVVVTCNGLAAPDIHLMVDAAVAKGADGVVVALGPSDFVLNEDLAPHVSYADVLQAARMSPALLTATRVRLGFLPRPYPRARNRPPGSTPGWPGAGEHPPGAVETAIEEGLAPDQAHWAQWAEIEKVLEERPAAVVVLPVHPDAALRGYVPARVGSRILSGIAPTTQDLARHDFSDAAPADQFSDLVHLRAPAVDVSRDLGRWIRQSLL